MRPFNPDTVLSATAMIDHHKGNHRAAEHEAWRAWYKTGPDMQSRDPAISAVAVEIANQYHAVPWETR